MDELTQLREAVIQLENRLSTFQSTNHQDNDMKLIIKHFKRVLRDLEAITPNHYDGLVMQMMGGF